MALSISGNQSIGEYPCVEKYFEKNKMFIMEKFDFPSSKFTDLGRKLIQFPSIISEFWAWKIKFLNDKHFLLFQIFFDARVLAYTLISAVLESAIGLSRSWVPKKPSKTSITTSFLESNSHVHVTLVGLWMSFFQKPLQRFASGGILISFHAS